MVSNYCCGDYLLMPDVWQRTLATVGDHLYFLGTDTHTTLAENVWDPAAFIPAAVVVNLGTNDKLDERPHMRDAYRAAYLELLVQTSAAFKAGWRGEGEWAGTLFVLVCGPMTDAYCSDTEMVLGNATRAGVRAVQYRMGADGQGCCSCLGHPSAAQDAVLAQSLTTFIRAQLGWWN